MPRSCRHLAPFGERRGAVLLAVVAVGELTVEVEEVVDRGVGGTEFLQGLDVPEMGHRPLSPSEGLVGIFGSTVKPAGAYLADLDANILHRRAIGT